MNTSRLRNAFRIASTCLLFSASLPLLAQTWSAYDNFTAANIDPAKWASRGVCANSGLDCERQISAGALHERVRTTGNKVNNNAESFSQNQLYVKNPVPVLGIASFVTIVGSSERACPTNGLTGSEAGLQSIFFNAGSGKPADDVFVELGISRSSVLPAGHFIVAALVVQGDLTVGPPTSVIGNVRLSDDIPLGEKVKLTMEWDRPNKQFVFDLQRFGAHAGTVRETISYVPLSDTKPALNNYKSLLTSNFAANCSPTPGVSDIRAVFDSVSVLK